jgi:hypothetical protein
MDIKDTWEGKTTQMVTATSAPQVIRTPADDLIEKLAAERAKAAAEAAAAAAAAAAAPAAEPAPSPPPPVAAAPAPPATAVPAPPEAERSPSPDVGGSRDGGDPPIKLGAGMDIGAPPGTPSPGVLFAEEGEFGEQLPGGAYLIYDPSINVDAGSSIQQPIESRAL